MRRLGYVFSAAGQGFWRNPVMSLASTFTVTLMLLLFSFFLTADRGLQAAIGVLESKVELASFLDDNAKVSEVLALKARIEADPAVSRVEYITKEQALKRLQDIADRRKDFVLADVDANLLPASLEIKLLDARQAKRLGDDLRAEIGAGVVADVIDNPQVVDQLLTITRVLSIGGIAILAMMLFVALFVIVNTIRIAVHARRDEIEIMQLVGASDWFVRWPFILEGMLVGALGAVVALSIVFAASGPVTGAMLDFLRHAADLARATVRVPARRERAGRGAPGGRGRGDAVRALAPRQVMKPRRTLTPTGPRWDHAPVMGTPRKVRGGGWRKSGLRATVVALTALALFVGQQMPVAADDPLTEALRRKEALERAVAVSRQNAERYKVAASQFQAAVDSANARIADLAGKQAVGASPRPSRWVTRSRSPKSSSRSSRSSSMRRRRSRSR